MASWTELLDRKPKMGASIRTESSPNPPLLRDSTITGCGRPTSKDYYTWKDVLMICLSLTCFIIAVLVVSHAPFAVQLTQKNQLIVIGFLLSLMSACLQRQAQLLLITLEARFGASTLQNYDSILRSSMLDANVGVLVKASLMVLFALPLALSASYKQFVSGNTSIYLKPRMLDFGPVGPPGLVNGAMAMTVNASLPVFNVVDEDYNATKLGTFGFNTAVISENMTAMLDAPLHNNLFQLQNEIRDGESLRMSAFVNATICTLNSTRFSPEREDPEYWNRTMETFSTDVNIADYGTGEIFGILSDWAEDTLILMSLWNVSEGETFISQAVGFNLYRGQCNATWQISHRGVTLEDTWDCTSAPEFVLPCEGTEPTTAANGTYANGSALAGQDLLQTVVSCNMMGLSQGYVWPFYNLLRYQPVYVVWVTAIASAVWAQIASDHGPTDWELDTPDDEISWEASAYPYVKYSAPVSIIRHTQTLHHSRWPLYLVLGIQPVLLLAFFCARVVLYATPVSNGFGLISLLAGVSREGLETLRGAGFSGELKRPVRIRIAAVSEDQSADDRDMAEVVYEVDATGRHGRVERGRVYG